jgi:hypothetical protein
MLGFLEEAISQIANPDVTPGKHNNIKKETDRCTIQIECTNLTCFSISPGMNSVNNIIMAGKFPGFAEEQHNKGCYRYRQFKNILLLLPCSTNQTDKFQLESLL